MANSGDASDTSTVLQSFSNRISLWFRSFSHCIGGCFGGSGTDDDRLLRVEPRDSNSAEPFPHRVAEESGPIFYPSPNVSQSVSQLSEEEQIMIAQKIGLIQHLPTGTYDDKKNTECVICLVEFVFGDHVRYLPCLHTYHTKCIDDWLMRNFICPSCMEPVDAALLIMLESQSRTKNEL